MEVYNAIIQAISSVGFPIVMSVILLYYIAKQTEAHEKETTKTMEAINKLEIAITKLTERIGGGDRA